MNPKKLFARLILVSGLVLVSASALAIPTVAVTVRPELVGSEIVFHYTLTRSGPEIITDFEVSVRPSGYGCETQDTGEVLCMGNYFGMLSLLPTGTTWVPAPDLKFREEGALSTGSTTQPAEWVVSLIGLRGEGQFKVQWKYQFIRTTSAPAAQLPSYSFSVRVPASPDPRGEYMNGLYHIKYFTNGGWQDLHALIALAPDTLPPVLSVTLTPSTMRSGSRLLSVAATVTATDHYDPLPAIKLESITANQTLSSGDISGATFGTDDRAFKLKPVKGRIYTMTYSATDRSGNKATATGTVTVR